MCSNINKTGETMKYKFDFEMFQAYNGRDCPCKIPSKDNVCPCKEFRETGKCICGLYKEIIEYK